MAQAAVEDMKQIEYFLNIKVGGAWNKYLLLYFYGILFFQ